MQTSLNKKSDIFERISQVIDSHGIKNISEFAKQYLGYNSPEKINRLKDQDKKPPVDILLDISNKFEDVSIDWLLTGKKPFSNNFVYSENEREHIIKLIKQRANK